MDQAENPARANRGDGASADTGPTYSQVENSRDLWRPFTCPHE